ncbi:MAG: hypothetical protein Q9225_006370 [Loekoesia sp. 1 TL-2023]
MQEQSKKPHLDGKRHAAQARQDRNATGSTDYKQIYADKKAKSKSRRNVTNNTERAKVDAALPASHSVSLIQGSPIISRIDKHAVQNTDEFPEYMAVSSTSNELLWKCTLCNLVRHRGPGNVEFTIREYVDAETHGKPLTYPQYSTELRNQQTYAHHYPLSEPSIPSVADNPLDQFFDSFSKFPYDACIPPATSYKNLRDNLWRWHDWDGHEPGTWKEYQQEVQARYELALTHEFNLWFGTEDDLKSWHALCRALGIIPLPLTCEECRSVISDRHVNIVDLIQWARHGERQVVQTFKTVKELSKYSYSQDKIFKKDRLGPGVVLRYLLRELSAARKRA